MKTAKRLLRPLTLDQLLAYFRHDSQLRQYFPLLLAHAQKTQGPCSGTAFIACLQVTEVESKADERATQAAIAHMQTVRYVEQNDSRQQHGPSNKLHIIIFGRQAAGAFRIDKTDQRIYVGILLQIATIQRTAPHGTVCKACAGDHETATK